MVEEGWIPIIRKYHKKLMHEHLGLMRNLASPKNISYFLYVLVVCGVAIAILSFVLCLVSLCLRTICNSDLKSANVDVSYFLTSMLLFLVFVS